MRDRPPTFVSFFARLLPGYLLVFALFGVLVALLFVGAVPWVLPLLCGIFFAGMLLGVIARDLGIFRRTLQGWPVMVKIIDWQHVEQLLEGETVDDPGE